MSERHWELCHCVGKPGKCPGCSGSTAYAADAVHFRDEHWHWPCLLDKLTAEAPQPVQEVMHPYYGFAGPYVP